MTGNLSMFSRSSCSLWLGGILIPSGEAHCILLILESLCPPREYCFDIMSGVSIVFSSFPFCVGGPYPPGECGLESHVGFFPARRLVSSERIDVYWFQSFLSLNLALGLFRLVYLLIRRVFWSPSVSWFGDIASDGWETNMLEPLFGLFP